LNCRYFHAVFTVPADLRSLFFQNQEKMYSLLFKAASETLLELCADKNTFGIRLRSVAAASRHVTTDLTVFGRFSNTPQK